MSSRLVLKMRYKELTGFLLLACLPLISNSRLNRRNSFDQVSHKGVFIQLPFANPPTVRPPPYVESLEICPEVNQRENWVDTLCGDLNKGSVPLNPLGQIFGGDGGSSYPFEIIKNKTLQFFRHALPVLRNDKSLPKVARYSPFDLRHHTRRHRAKRSTLKSEPEPTVKGTDGAAAILDSSALNSSESGSEARAVQAKWQKNLAASASRFCNSAQPKGSLICNLYHAMWGKPATAKQMQLQQHRQGVNRNQATLNQNQNPQGHNPQRNPDPYQFAESKDMPSTLSAENSPSSPATPCTSAVEYLTPVFARNHEGAWRYVVQIPREGYFTQTVEVTKCMETQCHFMEGSCLTSPRWQSLLVAEMFYPHASFPVTINSGNTLKRTGGVNSKEDAQAQASKIPSECDGVDEIGCFQVRLFYDWFLIPGSCKCWKRPLDFARFRQSH